MTKGVLLFAFNNEKHNYYDMAIAAAKRANHFLNLPTTLITNKESLPKKPFKFDNIIVVAADDSNTKDKTTWFNKGRYMAYELSPYDETLLIDTDYMINSAQLLNTFDFCDDFSCHKTTSYLMQPKMGQEMLSSYSLDTLWATVIAFKKTQRAKQIFDCLEMVQNNYYHYASIHSFNSMMFRNDYALTLALRIVNGHVSNSKDIIPWNLVHVGKNTHVYADSDDEFNTEYTVMFDQWNRSKVRKEFIKIKDTDFHCLNKDNFMELI